MTEQNKGRRTGATGGSAVATEQDIAAMSAVQLRGWLTEHGVTGVSGMRKEDLVKTAVKTLRSEQSGASGSTAGKIAAEPGATAKKSTISGRSGTGSGAAARPAKSVSGTAQPRAEAAPDTGEDVIDLLLSHHDQIKVMFGEMGRLRGEHQEEIWTQLCRMLIIHESIEQQLVHPLAQRRLPDGDEVIAARLDEEQRATQELAELWDMGIDDPRFAERFAVLRDDVTEHAELEEAEEFGWLRENVPPDQLIGLAAAARAADRIVPPGDMRSAEPLHIADRVREALRNAGAS
ncbi:hypothetical protein CS0771_70020 [Catellatospora sp. IY07-71]|uniref:hemerythrin domain-containing protein n=1 Tax=Catellatospora sp. IY07-71 TaxID=2728827 RepID=UPI001BB41B61|nr:hemerythrin domain-containing protein [Catellatospora sp. IY07-71]BCJ77458.1 hypothetical protein CS0771_70020 [Catellatospora sp. IY07-71]